MPVATTSTSTQTVETLKSTLGRLILQPQAPSFDLRQYAHFDSSPSIGTEFKSYSKEGRAVLNIRDILADEEKLRALGRLV